MQLSFWNSNIYLIDNDECLFSGLPSGVMSPTLSGFPLNTVTQSAPTDVHGNSLIYSMAAEPQLQPALSMSMASPYGGLGKLNTTLRMKQICSQYKKDVKMSVRT